MQARKMVTFLAVGVIAVAIGAASAFATVYAGPKTWLQGWDQDGPYDTPSYRFDIDGMGDKNSNSDSRVAFIDSNGTWHASYTDNAINTITQEPNYNYQKKPYCKNNSSNVYVATCVYY